MGAQKADYAQEYRDLMFDLGLKDEEFHKLQRREKRKETPGKDMTEQVFWEPKRDLV